MNKRRTAVLVSCIFSLVSILSTFPAHAGNTTAKKIVFDDWYVMHMYGKKASYEHVVLYETNYKGKDVYMVESERRTNILISGSRQNSDTRTVAYFTKEYAPLHSREERREGSQLKITEMQVDGDVINITTTLAGKSQTKTIRNEKNAVITVNGLLLKKIGKLKPGVKTSFRVVSVERGKITTERIQVLGKEKIRTMGKEVEAYKITSINDDIKDVTITVWVDESGNDIRVEGPGMVITKSSRDEAIKFGELADFSNTIDVSPSIPSKTSLTQMTLLVKVKDDKTHSIFAANNYQRVKKSNESDTGNQYRITLRPQPVIAAKNKKLPFSGRKFEKYLKPYPYIQSDDPEIIRTAKEIVGTEKDPLKAATLICDWIFKEIKKETSIVGAASAIETLKSKSGDCTEHAVLFCALARTIGLPARETTGLVYTGEGFGYHAWAEAFLGEKWIPIDPTVNAVGISATYILLGIEDESGSSGETISRMSRMFNRTSIEIISIERGKKKIDITRRANYITNNDKFFENKLWPIKIKKRKGWDLKEEMKSGNLILKKSGSRETLFIESGIAPPSLKILPGLLLKSLSQSQNMKVTIDSEGHSKRNGLDSVEILFMAEVGQEKVPVRIRVIAIVRGDTLYSFMGICSAEEYKEFKKDMDAFLSGCKFDE